MFMPSSLTASSSRLTVCVRVSYVLEDHVNPEQLLPESNYQAIWRKKDSRWIVYTDHGSRSIADASVPFVNLVLTLVLYN
jgi:hypothetical protein